MDYDNRIQFHVLILSRGYLKVQRDSIQLRQVVAGSKGYSGIAVVILVGIRIICIEPDTGFYILRGHVGRPCVVPGHLEVIDICAFWNLKRSQFPKGFGATYDFELTLKPGD